MARVIIRISLNGNNPEVTKQLTRVQKTLAEEWAGGFQRIGTAMWQGTAEPEQAGRVIALLLSTIGAHGSETTLDHFFVHIDGSDKTVVA
jgi:hypothetical protein